MEHLIRALLDRPQVEPLVDLSFIEGECILVTGAGGSIGSELVLQLIAQKAGTIILLDQSEFALYQIDHRVSQLYGQTSIVPVLGSIMDISLLVRLIKLYKVGMVVHAAAYKHVPMVERNPFAGVLTNTVGTQTVVDAVRMTGVKRLVSISTDKAVNPTNIMGASKKLAEYAVLCNVPKGSTYTVVRFGNVLGSTGSVLPLFEKQLRTTRRMTVTHPEVSRYFMSVQEAGGLVLQASGLSTGVFVLDMGTPVLIQDMARKLATLMGVDDYTIEFTGLRNGEKLYEELTLGLDLHATTHGRVMQAFEPVFDVRDVLESIRLYSETNDVGALRNMLSLKVPGYSPVCGIVCDLWMQENVVGGLDKLEDCYRMPTPQK